MAATGYKNSSQLDYPLTKMNFVVTVSGLDCTAAFNEISGMEATVETIEFRQGNAGSFSTVKVPGLVKHGNVTLKFGYTKDNTFRDWAKNCTWDRRPGAMPRHDVIIELVDTNAGMASSNILKSSAESAGAEGEKVSMYVLRDAWVCKYQASDFNAQRGEIAIDTVEIAYERLEIPGTKPTASA